MYRGWIGAALLAGLGVAAAAGASAQERQDLPAQPSIIQDESSPLAPPQPGKPRRGQKAAPAFEHDPDLDAADQFAPSQINQPLPPAVAEPSGGPHTRAASHGGAEPQHAGPGRPPRAVPDIVTCSGVFGRDSSQVKLAAAFHSKNVAFTQVDAGSGGTVMASVLFGKDPKRRLEVWWSKPATRSDTHLIVINGTSGWMAPGELRLGLTLADLERLNGKPFKLLGFNKDNVATLSNWDSGGLAAVAGGCKVGVSLRAASTASASALRALPADREFKSNDDALRAVNPTVSEILVAY